MFKWLSKFKRSKPRVYNKPYDAHAPSEAPVIYRDPADCARREGESYSAYCERVPLIFQPLVENKTSYLGKPL